MKMPATSLSQLFCYAALLVISVLMLSVFQNLFNDYIIRIICNIFIFMILAVSYNLINGVTGQLSLEPNGFVAVGGLRDRDFAVNGRCQNQHVRNGRAQPVYFGYPHLIFTGAVDQRPVRCGAGGVFLIPGVPGARRLPGDCDLGVRFYYQ